MQKENRPFYIFISIALFIFFILLLISMVDFNIVFDSIKYNVGSYMFSYIGNVLLVGFFLSVILFFSVLFFLSCFPKLKNKISISLTFSLILFVLLMGSVLIPELLGVQQIELHLNPLQNSPGTIKCFNLDSEGVMLVNDNISCSIKTSVLFDYVNLTFTDINNSKFNKTLDSSNNYSFIAPENIKRLSFDLVNESYYTNISTSWDYNFKTFEKYQSNRPVFLAAFLSLILLAFLTIPQIILSFKELFKENKNSVD